VRLLHTSDWHLGRSLHGVSLLDAQAAHIDHLVDTVRAERVGLVLVAGDVFDRALPPVDAVELASETFARLASTGTRVVVTSGNHDSPVRLGSHARLADAAGVHLRTRWQDVGRPVLVEDEHGTVAVYGLPYLDPDAVRQAWDLPVRSHEAALRAAMERVKTDLAGRGSARSVVLAHAFVAGSPEAAARLSSDSERDISVGGVQLAPTSLFRDVSYAALGHLHGAAELSPSVRYSGSPLAFSFSETEHVKGSWLVDLGPGGVRGATLVPAPVPRPLRVLRGRLDDLLTDRSLADAERCWVSVTLTDPRRPQHAMERVRTRFAHTLHLAYDPAGAAPQTGKVTPRVVGLSDLDVALGFVQEVREVAPTTEETLLLRFACDACRRDEDRDADHLRRTPEAG
jgi:exonuclease SbcD